MVNNHEAMLPSGHRLSLRRGDITDEAVDAIVNAANVGLIHGGGVAGAIVRKGGYVIQEESLRIRRPKTGEAAITGAGRLPAKFVIHAVGPVWRGQSPEESDWLLSSATTAALEIAREKELQSVAFPTISSGIFGFPKDRCARVMIAAVRAWANAHPDAAPHDIRFTIIDEATISWFEPVMQAAFGRSGMSKRDVMAGCLFGTALGDALARPTEFIREVRDIEARFGARENFELRGNPARVTDDTQMALAVGEALMAAEKPYTAATVEGPLRAAFVEWLDSPDNVRAPGMTCLSACRGLKAGLGWIQATVAGSKGCGANMRVQPVGLLDVDAPTRAALAQFQAALTHGHPTGLAASDVTAFAIADLAAGGDPAGLPDRLLDYSWSQREIYHADWLGDLWQRPGMTSPAEYIERGWDECIEVLTRLKFAAQNGEREIDPCVFTGEGWIAEEALATGLLCFLMYPNEPLAALRRAAYTSGDSDSIACLAGAFAGASLGISAWPDDWLTRIEYRDRLQNLADGLAGV